MTAPSAPGDADIATLHALLTHRNAEWAQRNPHEAMQAHLECQVSTCIAKTVAWGELQRRGKLVPDSSRMNRSYRLPNGPKPEGGKHRT